MENKSFKNVDIKIFEEKPSHSGSESEEFS